MNHISGKPLRISIVDYGMGNIASVRYAFAFLGIDAQIADSASKIDDAEAIILPGVGAFGEAMRNLETQDLVAPLTEAVMERKTPFLGLCLGMQLLAESSPELGEHQGLGWIPGRIELLPADAGHRVPHVGWASLLFDPEDPLFARISPDACFYFDHSYSLGAGMPGITATAEHVAPFAAVLRHDNIFATQFHPEKSQRNGLKLLRNFSNYCHARMSA